MVAQLLRANTPALIHGEHRPSVHGRPVYTSTAQTLQHRYDWDAGWLGLGASAGNITFFDEATDYIAISNAYLGIGTTSPAYALDVTGQARITSLPASSSNTVITSIDLISSATFSLAMSSSFKLTIFLIFDLVQTID